MTATAVPTVRERSATPRWWPGAGASAAVLSLLIVTVLWVGNGGPADLTDTVSGATYTSGGYLQSLQSALDAAGL